MHELSWFRLAMVMTVDNHVDTALAIVDLRRSRWRRPWLPMEHGARFGPILFHVFLFVSRSGGDCGRRFEAFLSRFGANV